MCCGARRSAWSNTSGASSTSSSIRPGTFDNTRVQESGPSVAKTTVLNSAQGQFPTVTFNYTGASTIRVRGSVTGLAYDFSPSQPSQAVDVRDAAMFVQNTAFHRSVA